MYSVLRFIPKNHLSYLIGLLAAIPVPGVMRASLYGFFAKLVKADLTEISKPLSDYGTFDEFFTRDLKAGSRPLKGPFVSPVDGVLRGISRIDGVYCEQIKGKRYSLESLIGDVPDSEVIRKKFESGALITLYLAPRHYHHVHSPCDAKITRVDYIPGRLWPVNDWSIRNIDGLFSVNERLNIYLTTKFGEMLLVMVGATNVGKMTLIFDSTKTNSLFSGACSAPSKNFDLAVKCGEKLGTFHLGSTVLLILPSSFLVTLPEEVDAREVLYGEPLFC